MISYHASQPSVRASVRIFLMLGARDLESKRRCRKASKNPLSQSSSKCVLSKKLRAGLFRHINQLLYSKSSEDAAAIMASEKKWKYADIVSLESFTFRHLQYHEGYEAQMNSWPSRPLDYILKQIRLRLTARPDASKTLIVDMGAGGCRLWHELTSPKTSVISVEFAPSSTVLESVPTRASYSDYYNEGGLLVESMLSVATLPDRCADIVVFCLSLMGLDWPKFLGEGYRILKADGVIFIVDLPSRFETPKAILAESKLKMLRYDTLDDGYFFALTLAKQ